MYQSGFVDIPLDTPCGREGSEGSEGSKGSEGGGGGSAADYKKGARLAPRVVSKGCVRFRSGGDSACGAEGCGLPLRAMLIKSALRDLLSVSYDMKTILLTGSLRSPIE